MDKPTREPMFLGDYLRTKQGKAFVAALRRRVRKLGNGLAKETGWAYGCSFELLTQLTELTPDEGVANIEIDKGVLAVSADAMVDAVEDWYGGSMGAAKIFGPDGETVYDGVEDAFFVWRSDEIGELLY